MRTAYDLSPLYRSMIGVDRMNDLIETAMRREPDQHFPPCDIEKTGEEAYRITLAVAGFAREELEITAQPNLLIVTGRKADEEKGRHLLHRGIPVRPFERLFELADFIVVKSADYADGLLTIELQRELPEALRPRQVEISTTAAQPAERIEGGRAGRKAA